jgi:hypothetical protein
LWSFILFCHACAEFEWKYSGGDVNEGKNKFTKG